MSGGGQNSGRQRQAGDDMAAFNEHLLPWLQQGGGQGSYWRHGSRTGGNGTPGGAPPGTGGPALPPPGTPPATPGYTQTDPFGKPEWWQWAWDMSKPKDDNKGKK